MLITIAHRFVGTSTLAVATCGAPLATGATRSAPSRDPILG